MFITQRLTKSFGARTLFSNVTLELSAGCRYGLIGANGSGKTTLLNILAGAEAPSDGTLTTAKGARLGVLRQDRFLRDDQLVLDVAMMGDEPVWHALRQQRDLAELGTGDARNLARLEDTIAAGDGYTLEARASAVLTGLGIAPSALRQPLSRLSGGHKLRVLLAQVLVGKPDAILLDEPTNHLDILSIRWLEKFLSAYAGCLVVVSHDHRFLDNVINHVLDVDYETVSLYTGNYEQFIQQKQATIARMQSEAERVQKRIDEKLAFVERFRAKATKARQAQSRLKQVERLEIPEIPRTSRRVPSFRFQGFRPSGRDVLEAKGISKAYGAHAVLSKVSLMARRGERIAILGPNGIGKSTLLGILVGALGPDEGSVRWGHAVRVGYFPQDHATLLSDTGVSVLDYLWRFCRAASPGHVRSELGRVLFSGDDVEKKLGVLSGGEAARLIFAQLMTEEPNVLLLDEPTNHLDLEAIEALVRALQQYDGTLLFVSHDRWFVSQIATRVLELRPEGHNDFPGTYEEYLAACGDDHLDSDAVARRAKQRSVRRAEPDPRIDIQREQRRRKSRIKALPQRRDTVLDLIEAAEARKREIATLYCQPSFFQTTTHERLAQLKQEEAEIESRLESLMLEWETLETELSAYSSED